MNYRHAFHAGNFADVLKHFVLGEVISRLLLKDAPLFFLDTHAGRGYYPLDDIASQRGGEFRTGILPVLAKANPPVPFKPYCNQIRRLGEKNGKLVAYPGSPRIALDLLRADDRAAFCELEPLEAEALRSTVRGDRRCAVHERNGYEALGALLPPPEKRGLVLIDPPYEDSLEFDYLANAVIHAHRRWSTGVYAIWYPITHDNGAPRFLSTLKSSGIRRQLIAQLMIHREDSPVGLNGAGMLLINPPWKTEETVSAGLRWLATLLSPNEGRSKVEWLVPE